jgi:hypothetical protein
MFRKKLAVLVAAALMTLSASSAFAAFADMELIRVVLDNAGTVEIATDLGNVNTIIAGGTFGSGVDAFTAQAGGTTAGLNVTYFAVNNTTKELWITGGASLKIGAGKSVTINGLTQALFSNYNATAPTSPAVNTIVADPSSGYHVIADATTQQGQFGSAIVAAGRPGVEASLATLAAAAVTQNLYYFKNYAAASTGVNVVTLSTNANGSTSTPTTTPIPAAFYLMGSGLMGLVGLRRRNKA